MSKHWYKHNDPHVKVLNKDEVFLIMAKPQNVDLRVCPLK